MTRVFDDSQTSNNVSTMSRLPVSTPSSSNHPNAAEALKLMAQQHQQPMEGPPPPPSSMPAGGYPPTMFPGDRNYQQPAPPPTSTMDGGNRASGGGPPSAAGGGQTPPGMLMRPRMQHDGDPRLRAAVQQRFRLGTPSAGQMGPGSTVPPSSLPNQPTPLTDQQRMEMMRSNPNMMNMAAGQGGMMAQQQVDFGFLLSKIVFNLSFDLVYNEYFYFYYNLFILFEIY